MLHFFNLAIFQKSREKNRYWDFNVNDFLHVKRYILKKSSLILH